MLWTKMTHLSIIIAWLLFQITDFEGNKIGLDYNILNCSY